MKKAEKKQWIWILILLIFLPASHLSAQGKKGKNAKVSNDTVTTAAPAVQAPDTLNVSVDSLQNLIESLRKELADTRHNNEQLQATAQTLRSENLKLRKYNETAMEFVLNYGNALLYRKYNARVEDIATLLSSIPDSVKQKDRAQMLAEAKKMIQSSNVTQDMRSHVFQLLERVPYDNQTAQDIQEVLQKVPAGVLSEYNLSKNAITLIDALPRDVRNSDSRYDTVRELLVAYEAASQEVKQALKQIQDDERNSRLKMEDSWPIFVKQLKETHYYKTYYARSWSIPYLNNIIDDALSRLQNASTRIKFDDLILKL